MFITEQCVDPRFNDGYAYVELDELRQAPVPHRVVYGGFRGTDARFAFYFPAANEYRGRFFHGPVHQLRLTGELVTPNEALSAFDAGAYLVQTNNGGSENCLSARENNQRRCDPSVRGYRVAAAAAKFSREIAQRVYDSDRRPYGYLYGGSGGAYQTLSAAERTRGVWDGFVPFVMGDPYALVAHFTLRAHAVRVLGDKFRDVVDAMDAGGSGDPYPTLNAEQAAALREVTRFGFPLRAWFSYASLGGANLLTGDYIRLIDPTYVRDFWSRPGYLGTARTPEARALRAARVQQEATVVSATPYAPAPAPNYPAPPYDVLGPLSPYYGLAAILQNLPPKLLTLDALPEGDLSGAFLDVLTGTSRGKSCPLSIVDRSARTVQCAGGSDPSVSNGMAPGDRLRVDNSFALAYETQARHDLPPAAWRVATYDQFRSSAGTPRHPQRRSSPGLNSGPDASGSIATGRFHGKVLVLNTLLDQDAFAYPAHWYRTMAREAGRERDLRVWFVDNSTHGGVPDATRTIDYLGVLEQGLRDVAAWVETGKAPASTRYEVDRDNQIQVPASAGARRGVQPVVDLTVAGKDRVVVRAGQAVTLSGVITAVRGTGSIVCAEWDPEGRGSFATARDVLPYSAQADPGGAYGNVISLPNPNCEALGPTARIRMSHVYQEPGTYFAVLRGTSHRRGDPAAPFARAQNLDRARIIVQ
jgi:hypothetical protein